MHDYFRGYDEIEIKTIYLECNEQVRESRMLDREVSNLNINEEQKRVEKLKEIETRLIKDAKLFQTVKCDYAIDASGTVEQTRDLIKTYL